MSDSNPKKHHYLPECYLKAFTNNQRQFWKRSKHNKKTSLCSPAQVGYEIGTNKIRNAEILNLYHLTDNNYVEKIAFRKQENNYSNTLNNVIRFSSSPLTIDKHKYRLFLETLITIKRRNPETRKLLIKAFREGYNSNEAIPRYKTFLLQEAFENNITIRADIDKYIQDYIEKRAANPDWLHDMYLTAYIASSDYDTIEKITDQLYALKQVILHAPLHTQFITSDNPGFTKEEKNIISAGGFGADFEFYFPLSPRTCLYIKSANREHAANIEKTIYPSAISDIQVSAINQCSKMVSSKKLFGNNELILANV